MRLLLLLFSLSIFTTLLSAKCGPSALKIYPQTKTINKNALIIIEGYREKSEILVALNKDYPIYLYSSDHRVELKIKEINEGMVGITQAILQPTEELISGKKYALIIENLNLDKMHYGNYLAWNSKTNTREPISWTVENRFDFQKPKLLESPQMIDSEYIRYGCGPAINAEFSLSINDESEIWIKAEFLDLESNEYHAYYLPLKQKETFKVGRDMCSGAFNYKRNKQYKVRFSFMDGCGNTDDHWTDWIEYNSPII